MPDISSGFSSRRDVLLVNEFKHFPVAAANMSGVGTVSMAIELQKHKMLTFLDKYIHFMDYPDEFDFNYVVPTFGITLGDYNKFIHTIELFPQIKYICIDVANGHMDSVLEMYLEMQIKAPEIKFIVGNIANPNTLRSYSDAGVWMSKIGVGSGSVCTTRIQTGVGVPQVTLLELMLEEKVKNNLPIKIMSDGGIKQIGDITKAFVLGADYVMMGGMFAGYDESEIKSIDGKIEFKGSSYGQTKDYVVDEGISVQVDSKGPVLSLVNDIMGGLRSAGTYLNSNLIDFNENKHLIIEVNRQKNDVLDGRSF